MIASLLVIFALLLMSAFFSASETALTTASRPLMHQMEQDGNLRARLVNQLRMAQDRLLGTILLGNNLVNILASSLATSALIELFGEAGVVYATGAMTVLVLIFGEILPKTYAIHNANSLALLVARPMKLLVALLVPVVFAIQAVIGGVMRLFGARYAAEANLTTALAELRGAIEMHAHEEAKQERAMLRSILDLEEVEVGEIMTHRRTMFMIDVNQPPEVILDQVLDSPFTRIPLWRDEPDNIIGMIHAKALLRAVRAHPGDLNQLDIAALATPPWFIPESTSLREQLQAFRERREHFALVVDEYGTLEGLVTLEDILEEIVGEIADEHDVAVSGVKTQPDGSYLVAGHVTIRDLNREFDWGLPDEEAATIAGLVLHEARLIPEVGQVFRFHNFRFEILRRQRNQITLLRLTPPDDGEEESH